MPTHTAPAPARLDLFDPGVHHHGPAIAAARELHWWAHVPGGVAVLRYAETAELLPDPRLHGGLLGSLAAQGVTAGPVFELIRDSMSGTDGAEQVRLRRLAAKAFTPRAIEGMRPRVRELTASLIEEFVGAGRCEFMADFANRLPALVTLELLGIPPELHAACTSSVTALGALFGRDLATARDRVDRAVLELEALTADLLATRRRAPGVDLISALIAAEDSGGTLSERELQVLVVTLLFATQDTTRNQLGLALATFNDHPEQWAMLATDPDLGPAATEEVMRVNPAVPYLSRVAARGLDHRDLQVPAGALLTFVIASANTDPRVFGTGGFDITATRPARQLTFGAGPHACLGMALARLQLAEALPMLAARLGPLGPAGPPQWPGPTTLYGPIRLPLTFGPSVPSAAEEHHR